LSRRGRGIAIQVRIVDWIILVNREESKSEKDSTDVKDKKGLCPETYKRKYKIKTSAF
jgi:hypothetical protein